MTFTKWDYRSCRAIKRHYTEQGKLIYSPVRFYSLIVLIITLLKTILTQILR